MKEMKMKRMGIKEIAKQVEEIADKKLKKLSFRRQ
jgi:hypothetical protein